jgi:hypothetical protein
MPAGVAPSIAPSHWPHKARHILGLVSGVVWGRALSPITCFLPAPPEAPMSSREPKADDWIIYRSSALWRGQAYHTAKVIKASAKQISVAQSTGYDRRIMPDQVVAVFGTHDEAGSLHNALKGVAGERDRRRQAADEAADKQAKKLIAEACQGTPNA